MGKLFNELLARQKQAYKNNKLEELNEINKQLFEIREHAKQQHTQAKEKAREERTAQAIYRRLEQQHTQSLQMDE